MLTVYDKSASDPGLSRRAEASDFSAATVWIDLFDPTPADVATVEAALDISIPTPADMREIETSSRLYAENGATYMTATFVSDTNSTHPGNTSVSFILARNCLVTVCYAEQKAFQLFVSRAAKRMQGCESGASVLAGIVEAQIDITADRIERIQDEVEQHTTRLFNAKIRNTLRERRFEAVLFATGREGDRVASAQESALSVERLLGFFRDKLRRDGGDEALQERIATAQRDISSLNEHMGFLADRITFLLSATLGMINTEQNQIIKLFSVMAVMLMPPTLVASVYGMNFRHMPELDWPWGYPLALTMMIASAGLPFIYFRRKGWL